MNNFSVCTYVPSDAQAVVDVINTSSTLTVGFPRAVVEAVGNLWAYHFIPFSSEKVVAINNQNEVVGYAYFTSADEHIVAETGGAIHPEYWGRRIGTALVKGPKIVPKLYNGLGMKPYRNEFTLEKEIRTGREVRRLY